MLLTMFEAISMHSTLILPLATTLHSAESMRNHLITVCVVLLHTVILMNMIVFDNYKLLKLTVSSHLHKVYYITDMHIY